MEWNLDALWQDYGLDRLESGIAQLFPKTEISAVELLEKLLAGDVAGAGKSLLHCCMPGVADELAGMKNVLIWLLVMGIISALLTHFVDIFNMHQVADIAFYFLYLLFMAVLLKCFYEAMETAAETMENITLFIRLLVPAYLMSVGVAGGTATAGAACQLMLLVIYGVETMLSKGILSLVSGYVMLSMVNGIWAEEKLTMLVELLKKAVGWALRGALGVITGISVFQALITPVVDSARSSAVQKLLSALPGVGNVADGAVELVLGSALVIRNSIGVALLLLMLALCAVPLIKLCLITLSLKCAAAFMGVVSDRRITSCVDRTGEGGLLLLRTTGTAMLLFMIATAVVAAAGRG